MSTVSESCSSAATAARTPRRHSLWKATRDTTHYVATAAAIATTCAVCRRPLQPNEPLSLSVDIIESTAPDGTDYVTFRDYVCHRQGQGTRSPAAGTPEERARDGRSF
jgi:hypothetical protein